MIANEFGEAASTRSHRAALIAAGLVLFVLTLAGQRASRATSCVRAERSGHARVPKGMAG